MVGLPSHSKRGFALLEVMIALGVFVILTLVFAACVPVAKKTAKMNGQYSQALSLCQHKIDQLRAVGYGRINYEELSDARIVDDSPNSAPYSFLEVDDVSEYLTHPTATVTVEELTTDVVRVTATVTWTNTAYESKESSATLTAIITNVE